MGRKNKIWKEKKLLIKIFITFYILYSAFAFHVGSNDDTRLFYAMSVLDRGDTDLDEFPHLTLDYVKFKGKYFLDKPVGMSILSLPIYGIYKIFNGPIEVPDVDESEEKMDAFRHEMDILILLLIFTISAPIASFGVLIFYSLLAHFIKDRRLVTIFTFIYGLDVLIFMSGRTYTGYTVSVPLVLLSFYLLIKDRKDLVLLSGITFGLSLFFDLTTIFFLIPFLVLMHFKKSDKKRFLTPVVISIILSLIFTISITMLFMISQNQHIYSLESEETDKKMHSRISPDHFKELSKVKDIKEIEIEPFLEFIRKDIFHRKAYSRDGPYVISQEIRKHVLHSDNPVLCELISTEVLGRSWDSFLIPGEKRTCEMLFSDDPTYCDEVLFLQRGNCRYKYFEKHQEARIGLLDRISNTLYGAFNDTVLDYLTLMSIMIRLLIDPSVGLFFFSPILLLSFFALRSMYRGKHRGVAISISAMLLISTALLSLHRVWWGPGMAGNRHLSQLVPFLLFSVAILVSTDKRWLKAVIPLAILGIFITMITLQAAPVEFINLDEKMLFTDSYMDNLQSFRPLSNPMVDHYIPRTLKSGPDNSLYRNIFGDFSPAINVIIILSSLLILWYRELGCITFKKC